MDNKILLFIAPAYDALREDMGYGEFDDYDENDILYQRGYNGEILEIEDGEIFDIPEGYTAAIQNEDTDEIYYLLENEEDLDFKENFIIDESLPELTGWTSRTTPSGNMKDIPMTDSIHISFIKLYGTR